MLKGLTLKEKKKRLQLGESSVEHARIKRSQQRRGGENQETHLDKPRVTASQTGLCFNNATCWASSTRRKAEGESRPGKCQKITGDFCHFRVKELKEPETRLPKIN